MTMLTQSYERDPVTGVRRVTVRLLSDSDTAVWTESFETPPRDPVHIHWWPWSEAWTR